MSGFFGIFNRNGKPVDKNIAQDMMKVVSSWEPDEQNLWCEGSVALGHSMLWNTPESKYEHLPLQEDVYILTMDARIDNRDELVNEIELPDKPLSQIGDSEFILGAYKKWGEECPKHLLGDFAFVVWDEKKEQIFCARDHVGIKSFYYYVDDNLVVFSNDIETILANCYVCKELDDATVATFLKAEGIFMKRDTFFKKIKKLPPATIITISMSEVKENLYWSIEESPFIEFSTYEEYVYKLRELYQIAVKARLRTTYKIASHLSGGIDSSPIAVLAARKLQENNQNLYAFNWLDIPLTDDKYEYEAWNFSRRIANTEKNIIHDEFCIDENFWVEQYQKHNIFTKGTMYYWQEYYVQEAVKQIGARTLLSGWGGDELISHNGRSYILGLLNQMKIFMAIKYLLLEKKYQLNSAQKWVLLKYILKFILPSWIVKSLSKKKNEEKDSIKYEMYMTPEFIEFSKLHKIKEFPDIVGVRKRQLTLFYYGHLQERIESWSLSAFPKKFEYRYPLLDKRIIEFAIGIPEEMYYPQKGKNRHLIKNAVKDLLPIDILWFPKPNETKVNHTIKHTYMQALRLVQKKYKKGLFKCATNNYLDGTKVENKISDFDFEKSDVFELGNLEAVILFSKAKEYLDYYLKKI